MVQPSDNNSANTFDFAYPAREAIKDAIMLGTPDTNKKVSSTLGIALASVVGLVSSVALTIFGAATANPAVMIAGGVGIILSITALTASIYVLKKIYDERCKEAEMLDRK